MDTVGEKLAGARLSVSVADAVSCAVLNGLSDTAGRSAHYATTRSIDSRQVVRLCTEAADGSMRLPSIRELCEIANVSERRLRNAFIDVYDCPPLTYLRHRSLNRSRLRLLAGDPRWDSVTNVAMDSGFSHLGRFAASYRQLFGEAPSVTLWTGG
jgi:AraC-like DNA-binding protein